MPIEDHPEEDQPPANGPLPPEDRLWRHPSELASTGSTPPATWFEPAAAGRAPRWSTRTALAGACLTGAVVALAVMWVARPTRVVERTVPAAQPTAAATTPVTFTIDPARTERLARQLTADLARVRVQRSGTWTTGSGVWLDTPGALVVAAPLVALADRVLVTDASGRTRTGTVAGIDQATGIAVLEVAGADQRSTLTTQTSPARAGGTCAVVGAPAVEAGGLADRATIAGVIIRAASLRTSVGGMVLQDAIHLDRPIPSDAGGGALVDASGRFIGLVIGNSTDRFLAAAVPASTIAAIADDLLTKGTVRRAWLGVQASDLDPSTADELDVPGGARITEVTPASPAAAAGLHTGDIVVAIEGVLVDDASDLVVQLRAAAPGDEVTIMIATDAGPRPRRVELGG